MPEPERSARARGGPVVEPRVRGGGLQGRPRRPRPARGRHLPRRALLRHRVDQPRGTGLVHRRLPGGPAHGRDRARGGPDRLAPPAHDVADVAEPRAAAARPAPRATRPTRPRCLPATPGSTRRRWCSRACATSPPTRWATPSASCTTSRARPSAGARSWTTWPRTSSPRAGGGLDLSDAYPTERGLLRPPHGPLGLLAGRRSLPARPHRARGLRPRRRLSPGRRPPLGRIRLGPRPRGLAAHDPGGAPHDPRPLRRRPSSAPASRSTPCRRASAWPTSTTASASRPRSSTWAASTRRTRSKGDGQVPVRPVEAAKQREALDLLLEALSPANLEVPEHVLSSPRARTVGPGSQPRGVRLRSGLRLQPPDRGACARRPRGAAAARAGAGGPSAPDRGERRRHSRRAPPPPARGHLGGSAGPAPHRAALQRVAQRVVLDAILDLAAREDASPEVRALVTAPALSVRGAPRRDLEERRSGARQGPRLDRLAGRAGVPRPARRRAVPARAAPIPGAAHRRCLRYVRTAARAGPIRERARLAPEPMTGGR